MLFEYFGPDNTDAPGCHDEEVFTRNSRIVENCTRSVQLAEPMRTHKKENMRINDVIKKVDAKVGVNLYLILIDIIFFIVPRTIFIPWCTKFQPNTTRIQL